MKDIGNAVAFRLRGTKSNRDAIGASIRVESGGHSQTKFLQAGSGFLSQHTKELFFGIGNAEGKIRAIVRWPSGTSQTFEQLPINNRIELQEGSEDFAARPFPHSSSAHVRVDKLPPAEPLPLSSDTWLIEPLHAPDFSLLDIKGKPTTLKSLRGSRLLLHFWAAASPECGGQLRVLEKNR